MLNPSRLASATASPTALPPSDTAPGPTAASARPLAAMLLAAIVSALLVAADALIDTYADGHLLLAWSLLWALGFAALALFANATRQAARRLLARASSWRAQRAEREADAAFWLLAQRDPRIMADLQGAMERAREAQRQVELVHGRAWVEHRPIGTLNAGYTGPRRLFRTSPVTGMPTHQHVYPA